ncbi:type II toxin-antitoxin system RelE/ParE family toxin [Desulfomicrobium salsuginis]
MNVSFHPLARAELVHAIEYYEECEPGLGAAFMDEVIAAVARLKLNPSAWSPFTTRTRRCRTKRFPFSIIYHVRHDHLEIVAVANLRRRPGYWIDRLNENKAPYEAPSPGASSGQWRSSRKEG